VRGFLIECKDGLAKIARQAIEPSLEPRRLIR
jgi:hypothetical protein